MSTKILQTVGIGRRPTRSPLCGSKREFCTRFSDPHNGQGAPQARPPERSGATGPRERRRGGSAGAKPPGSRKTQASRQVLPSCDAAILPDYMNDRSNYPVRRTRLNDQHGPSLRRSTTASERLQMVWPLTLGAWQFKEPLSDEPRLRRDVVRIVRGRR
jgi:hypothetical protein